MRPLYLHGVGLSLPGLTDWRSAQAVLAGEAPYVPAETITTASQLLPPNERRRAPLAVRLAFRAAEDAVTNAGLDAAQLATVFATSDADTPIIHRIGSALSEPTGERIVSPTDFHNCVHNAAAGYWGIAVGSRRPSCSLSAWDASFAAGLLESAALVHGDGEAVLLAAFDIPPPVPLHASRPIAQAAGVALVLSAEPRGALAGLTFAVETAAPAFGAGEDAEVTRCTGDPALEALRLANPACRALPLLQRLAAGTAGTVTLALPSGLLRVQVQPR